MQETVVVQPLLAIAATKSPKPFSSTAVHSVWVIRQATCCALAADDPIVTTPATNAMANEERNWQLRCQSPRTLTKGTRVRHQCVGFRSLELGYWRFVNKSFAIMIADMELGQPQ